MELQINLIHEDELYYETVILEYDNTMILCTKTLMQYYSIFVEGNNELCIIVH